MLLNNQWINEEITNLKWKQKYNTKIYGMQRKQFCEVKFIVLQAYVNKQKNPSNNQPKWPRKKTNEVESK